MSVDQSLRGNALLSRRFLPLFVVQALSALSDNALKNGLVFTILAQFAGTGSAALVSLAGAAFTAPFLVLSALGGELADGGDKAKLIRRLKLIEVGIAAIAACGFAFQSVGVLMSALFGFGVIAALFGPAKYAILPDHLTAAEIPAANAAIEASTFLAILAGSALGAAFGHAGGAGPIVLAAIVAAAALVAFAVAFFVPPTIASNNERRPNRNVMRSTLRALGDLREPALLACAVATSLFWLVGAVILALLPVLVTRDLGGGEMLVVAHLAIFAVALTTGSFVAAWLAGGRILLLPTLVGACITTVAVLDAGLVLLRVGAAGQLSLGLAAYVSRPGALHVAFDLAVLAFGGGLVVVPSFSALQVRAAPSRRARAVAAAGILNAAFMIVGALAVAGLQKIGLSTGGILVAVAGATALVAAWLSRALPMRAGADAIAIALRCLYRIEVRGAENLAPERAGPNPVVAINHLSFLDAVIAMSILPSRPAFAIDAGIARRWWLRPLVKRMNAIPLEPASPFGTRTLVGAVKAGSPLVIFPEGRISVTGALMKVYDGAALVADKAGVPVVPVRLEGPEATVFSHLDRRQVRKRWFPKIIVTILPPTRLAVDEDLKGRARRQAAGAALYAIMSDAAFATSLNEDTVFERIVKAAMAHGPSRIALEDPLAGPLSYRRLLTAVRALAKPIARLPAHELAGGLGPTYGVMLPSSVGAAVTILAVQSAGATPAMINFTAGKAAIMAACTAARVRTVVTSRAFIEKAKLGALVAALTADPEVAVEFAFLEDLQAKLGRLAKLAAALSWRRAAAGRRSNDEPGADRPAAILFTSGSEGAPKGVVLTHRNVLANVAQVTARIDFGRTDKVFSVLPTFHSFGLVAGLVLPLTSGVPVYLYPSPLHYRVIPELVYASNATVLFGTDTFLTGYARAANDYDFRSLRYVVAGAEPVRTVTRMAWLEKFGLRLLEGYGVTETSPVLALNTPMFNRFGTVGRIMPGMEWRLEPVEGVPAGGRLIVRGPNVMAGYVKADRPGVLQPPIGGLYDTGDIVEVDARGFITIKGRAKRFAKIGGEMVSLAAIETIAADLWPRAQSACASVPDPRKGERIILFTTEHGATRETFARAARAGGLAEVGYPARVEVVEALPLLGSGKIDFKALNALAFAISEPAATTTSEAVLEDA